MTERERIEYRKRRWLLLKSFTCLVWVVSVASLVFFVIDPKDFGLWMPFVTVTVPSIVGVVGYYIKKDSEHEDANFNVTQRRKE